MKKNSAQQSKPLQIDDIIVIDNTKPQRALTAATLGNAMEWFDFVVYTVSSLTLWERCSSQAPLLRYRLPLPYPRFQWHFFAAMGDHFGRQNVLSLTIIIVAISTFSIGLIPSYEAIGLWAPLLLLMCKLTQGFSVGGEYTGAAAFVTEYAPDRRRGFLGS